MHTDKHAAARHTTAPADSTRRRLLGAGLVAGLAGPGIGQALAATGPQDMEFDERLPERFRDPDWNRDTFARLQGSLAFGEQKFGWYSGVVHGVREDEKVRPLMGFEGFSATRLVDNGDGSYQKLLREIVLYTDLKTGEILEHFDNPYTGERVRVVHIANDPFNFVISNHYPEPPKYGGLNKEKPPRIPFLLPWRITRKDTVTLATDIHLYYPSALQPDKWPRESAGRMNRVSEMFRYVIRREELEDPDRRSVEYTGSWGRITPWLPWMLMGQAPGHMYYQASMGGYDNLDPVSAPVIAYAREHMPTFFTAPEKWTEPSLSSLENYAREQTPAPPREAAE